MAVDKKIPQSQPGVAGFSSETFGNSDEPRFGDTPVTTTEINVSAMSEAKEYDLYTVLDADGDIAQYDSFSGSTACYIAAQPIYCPPNTITRVTVYRTGHFNLNALIFDDTYDTESKKLKAFDYANTLSPGLFISKPKFSDDAIFS